MIKRDHSVYLNSAIFRLINGKNYFWAFLSLGLIFAGLTAYMFFGAIGHHYGFLDLHFFLQSLFPEWIWASITRFGDERLLFLLSILFIRRRPEIFWALIVSALIAIAYSRGLKITLDELRPYAILGDQVNVIGPELKKHSFPSGHTVSAFVFFGVLAAFAKNKIEFILLLLIASLVGLSRVAVGAHWPIDILAGASGGLLSVFIGIFVTKYWHKGLTNNVYLILIWLPIVMGLSLLVSNSGNPEAPWIVYPVVFSQFMQWCNEFCTQKSKGIHTRFQYDLSLFFVSLIILLQIVFYFFPEVDLEISGWFYDPQNKWFLSETYLVQFSYWLFANLHFFILPLLGFLFIVSWRYRRRKEMKTRRTLVFLFITLLLGPGYLVNEFFKNYSHRARPLTVEQFGGELKYTPPFVKSDQCEKNCSFVSGHAALGFYFLAFAWATGRGYWLFIGAMVGGAVGLGRVIQGAHFTSDVLFGYFVVLFSAILCARLILGRWSFSKANVD